MSFNNPPCPATGPGPFAAAHRWALHRASGDHFHEIDTLP